MCHKETEHKMSSANKSYDHLIQFSFDSMKRLLLAIAEGWGVYPCSGDVRIGFRIFVPCGDAVDVGRAPFECFKRHPVKNWREDANGGSLNLIGTPDECSQSCCFLGTDESWTCEKCCIHGNPCV